MPSLTFFNLGNADGCRIDLADGQKILLDFANLRDPDDEDDKRVDLARLLTDDLNSAERDYFDVVAFTHLDTDHVQGASDFFWFDWAEKYQGDDRVKINELWVPALAITEAGVDGDAYVIRQEARHRLREGYGVKVFSRPAALKDWLAENGLTVEDRAEFIVDAGTLVPGYVKTAAEGVEFFSHAPFAKRQDETLEDRNMHSLVFQATFQVDGYDTPVILSSDITHEVWADIVDITRWHENDDRLAWFVYKLPHHCSYTAIGPEKGDNKTEPSEQVQWLCEEQGSERGIVVSSSNPVPHRGTDADKDVQPPHRQAANYYREDVVGPSKGKFLVTMEEPSKAKPKPIVINITGKGATHLALGAAVGATAIAGTTAPRAGNGRA